MTIDEPSAAIAFVVDPARRGCGYANAMITRLVAQPELDEITLFGAGVEPDNVASVRTLAGAGFHPLGTEPDCEGIIYFVWQRRQIQLAAPAHLARPLRRPVGDL